MREFEVTYKVTLTIEAPNKSRAEEEAFDTLNELVGHKYLIVFHDTEEN